MIPHQRHNRLLMGSPLQRSGWRKTIIAALLVLLAYVALFHIGVFATGGRVFLQALALSSLLVLVPLGVLWFLDRRERETPWLLAAAFLWGGFIATAVGTAVKWPHPAIGEEFAKALGVLLIFWLARPEFNNMRDGFVYGALIGLGSTWWEAASYVYEQYPKFGAAAFSAQLGYRYALFGFGSHTIFSGIFGASLGFALQTRHRWLRIFVPITAFVLVSAGHMLTNSSFYLALFRQFEDVRKLSEQSLPGILFLYYFAIGSLIQLTMLFPLLLIMVLAVWRSGVWERRVIREELASEVGDTVTPEEYQAIIGDRMFRTRRIDRMHRQKSAALVNAQNKLAFRKRRVKDEGGDPEQDSLVAGWRDDIRRLRLA